MNGVNIHTLICALITFLVFFIPVIICLIRKWYITTHWGKEICVTEKVSNQQALDILLKPSAFKISYVVDGVLYGANLPYREGRSGFINYKLGEELVIYYNPNDPNKIVTEKRLRAEPKIYLVASIMWIVMIVIMLVL